MTVLTDRASLKRQLFRLINSDDTDGGSTEYDPDDTPLEGLYLVLERGVRKAQQWLIHCGLGEYWLATSDPLTFSGTDAADAGRYATLPTDFLRAYGDRHESCLREPSGMQWGREVSPRDRLRYTGNGYYFAKDQIWLTRRATPSSSLVLDYYAKVDALVDDTTVDFPEDDRELIVAYAADEASKHPWFLGGMEEKQGLQKHLADLKYEVYNRSRRSRQPRGRRERPNIGSRYY